MHHGAQDPGSKVSGPVAGAARMPRVDAKAGDVVRGVLEIAVFALIDRCMPELRSEREE